MEAFEPFTSSFTMLKMRYRDYDESISSMHYLNPDDKVNVFINLETIFRYLTRIQDLENKIIIQREFDQILVSNMLNLAAHYKKFFTGNGLDTKVYLYHTDFSSDDFMQFKYNEDYRSYYLLKYNRNSKYILLSEHLKDTVLPEVKTLCEFIPNVYYISAKDMEGSLVPLIISKVDPTRKNLIIGGELYDTQYTMIPNFVNHYVHRAPHVNAIFCDVSGYIQDITKKEQLDYGMNVDLFKNYPIYCTLISVIGDKIRSIYGIHGYNYMKLLKALTNELNHNTIQEQTSSPEMIGDIFHDSDIKSEFINNYYCTSILSMYQELTEAKKKSVINQMIDRMDLNSISQLNQSRFFHHPILLEALF